MPVMEVQRKLEILADAAKYDASCASSGVKRKGDKGGLGSATGIGICHSYTPDGRCVSLLKILLTNYCVFDCRYCVNRISSDVPRARFSVEEVVQLTLDFYRRNYIEGLFLSSGIIQSADYTMEQLARVAKTLRTEHAFRGYIHLKTIPGASEELLQEAGRWADRLSINIELPTAPDLEKLAPEKKRPVIEGAMAETAARIKQAKAERKESKKAPIFAPAGQSTQMIVGATDTPDAEILKTSSTLYNQYKLKRVYFSAFSPIPHSDLRLPIKPPPLVRENRLYQADWLMRFYGFSADELTTPQDQNLDLSKDPKLAWALRRQDWFPIDVNKADKELLLRIPGAGVRSVQRILQARRMQRLRLDDLKKLGVVVRRALPFVITLDHVPTGRLLKEPAAPRVAQPQQMLLWDAAVTARTGEM